MSTESMTTTGAAVPQAAADGVTNPKGIGLFRMVTTVITLIVGAGAFSLVGRCGGRRRERWAILTAWGISAIGVFCLVMTFFALSRVKPDLKGGIYTYAATGFGDFLGFNSAWGYWISALLCTVSFWRFCSARCRTSSRSSGTARTSTPSSEPPASSGSTPSGPAAASAR